MTIAPTAEHARLIRKLESISTLDAQDKAAIARLPLRTRSVDAGVDLVVQGDVPTECCFVVDGLLCRYATTTRGGRQILSFQTPGDMPDRDSLHLPRLDHSVGSISVARVAFVRQSELAALVTKHANIALALWRDSVIDAGISRQWLISVGRRNARQRVAHLVCEMFTRLERLGLSDGDHFSFPATQAQVGDALGLSSVHTNRTLQELRTDGLLSWRSSVVTIPDFPALADCGDFDESYLQLKPLPL